MDKNAFMAKLRTIEEVQADETDLLMIKEAQAENDNTRIDFDNFKEQLSYSGKISLRLPKSLHKNLAINAKAEGVSLNQFLLYKLSH